MGHKHNLSLALPPLECLMAGLDGCLISKTKISACFWNRYVSGKRVWARQMKITEVELGITFIMPWTAVHLSSALLPVMLQVFWLWGKVKSELSVKDAFLSSYKGVQISQCASAPYMSFCCERFELFLLQNPHVLWTLRSRRPKRYIRLKLEKADPERDLIHCCSSFNRMLLWLKGPWILFL